MFIIILDVLLQTCRYGCVIDVLRGTMRATRLVIQSVTVNPLQSQRKSVIGSGCSMFFFFPSDCPFKTLHLGLFTVRYNLKSMCHITLMRRRISASLSILNHMFFFEVMQLCKVYKKFSFIGHYNSRPVLLTMLTGTVSTIDNINVVTTLAHFLDMC